MQQTIQLRIPVLRSFTTDARNFQIVYLSLFLLYGFIFLDWSFEWYKYATLIGTCLFTQVIAEKIFKKKKSSWKSALITSLGLALLYKANGLETVALGAFLAISSKFLLRYKGKHIFNPANFGIIVAILLTGEAWISPGQWGSSAILLYFFGAAALMVLLKVGRIDTSLGFLITFALLEFSRTVLYLGWGTDVFIHKMCNGSLLLFAFFMITDPVTTPNSSKARWYWAIGTAVIAFVLTNWFYVHTAPMWALFFISPVTVLLDRYFKSKKFHW